MIPLGERRGVGSRIESKSPPSNLERLNLTGETFRRTVPLPVSRMDAANYFSRKRWKCPAVNYPSATPRLSIVLPLGNRPAAFEDTLISVLENRPSASEILVVHDGGYDDPFDLSDEVRFVVGQSNDLVDAIAGGCDAAWGRYVHVLEAGFRATPDWTDHALAKFEHSDSAAVAPVIRDRVDSTIVAAGWVDRPARLMDAHSAGAGGVTPLRGQAVGAYLAASFWRREVLRSLTRASVSIDPLVSSYAYGQLARGAGWHCVVAENCDVILAHDHLDLDEPSFGRGKKLRALKNHFDPAGSAAGILATLASAGQPSLWMESLGQILGGFAGENVARWFNEGQVHSAQQYEAVRRAA